MSEEQCHKCVMEERVRFLENSQTETKVYVKQIQENLQDIKATLKSQGGDSAKQWNPVMLELIKLVGQCVLIIGAIAGVAKFLGK